MPGIRNAFHDAQMDQQARARAAVERIMAQERNRTSQPIHRNSPEGPSVQPRHPHNVRDTPTGRGYRKKTRKGRKVRKTRKSRKSRK